MCVGMYVGMYVCMCKEMHSILSNIYVRINKY